MSHRRPNILLMFTDQQRGDTLGALGNPMIRTPNLDRLCAEGVSFANAFTPSPVCVPARCSMLYGQYPHHTQCYENRYAMPEDGRASLAGTLTQAGYRTHAIGKCHFTPDPHALRGFETRQRQEEIVGSPDEDDYLKHLHDNGFGHVCDPHGVRGELYYVPQPAQMPARLHPTQWVGDQAVQFIEGQSDSSQPWLLYAGFVNPHPPFAPPCPWHKLYRAALMPSPNVPANYESLLVHVNRRQNRSKWRDQGIDPNLVRCMRAHYYACVSFIDFQVGRMVDALAAAGQLDNTLVLFASDHGELLGDYNSFGKRSMHDAAARIPMVARLPGSFEGGGLGRQPVSLVDVAPTIAAAAGTEIATHTVDGVDLAEVAGGRVGRDAVFAQHDRAGLGLYMAVSQRWKYIYSVADQQAFLFDRVNDPMETRNLVGVSFTAEARDRMRAALVEHLRGGGEAEALDGDGFREYPKVTMPSNPDEGLLVQDHPWADTRLAGYTD